MQLVFSEDLHQALGLGDSAREAIEHEARSWTIVLGQSLTDDTQNDVVAHEVAGVHDGLGCLAHLRPGSNRAAEHVPRRNVRHAKVLDQSNALGSLARALTTEDDHSDGLAGGRGVVHGWSLHWTSTSRNPS